MNHLTKRTKIINSRWRQPPFWISSIAHNSFTVAHICTKFGMCITLEILHASIPKYWTKLKSKMAAAAILDFCTNSNNSAADWRRWMQFCINVYGCHRKRNIWPKWTKIINSRWRRPPFWISFIAHNSFIIAHNCTKYGTCITFEVLHTSMPSWIFAQ